MTRWEQIWKIDMEVKLTSMSNEIDDISKNIEKIEHQINRYRLVLNDCMSMLDKHDNTIENHDSIFDLVFSRLYNLNNGIKLLWVVIAANVCLNIGIALKIYGIL